MKTKKLIPENLIIVKNCLTKEDFYDPLKSEPVEIKNTPTSGIYVKEIKQVYCESVVCVYDPRGFTAYINPTSFIDLLKNTTIDNGVIDGDLVYAPAEYRSWSLLTEDMAKKLISTSVNSLKDLKPGNIYSRSERKLLYLGLLPKLESGEPDLSVSDLHDHLFVDLDRRDISSFLDLRANELTDLHKSSQEIYQEALDAYNNSIISKQVVKISIIPSSIDMKGADADKLEQGRYYFMKQISDEEIEVARMKYGLLEIAKIRVKYSGIQRTDWDWWKDYINNMEGYQMFEMNSYGAHFYYFPSNLPSKIKCLMSDGETITLENLINTCKTLKF